MHTLLFFNIGGQEIILLFFILIFAFLWVWALVDVIRSDFKRDIDKIIWLLLIVFASFIGVLLYLAIGRNQRIPSTR